MLAATDLSNTNRLSPPIDGASLCWLGQAGFLLEIAGKRIVIDPYLSDSLAEKYRGKKFPHIRMMPAPLRPEELTDIDWLFCTHGHTDHMDPGTIPGLLATNAAARILVPRAEMETARQRGAPADRLIGIGAGERLDLGGFEVLATASAHEDLRQDDNGQHLYLGYVVSTDGMKIWHSGDTIPYQGLSSVLAPLAIDLALLPINGRDATRAANGVPGNLTVEEAVSLADEIGARAMLGHHYGMFDFNTADPDIARQTIAGMAPKASVGLAETEREYQLAPKKREGRIRVLAVCRGNICRSPTAEALLRKHLDPARFEIDSAAIKDWNIGKSPDPRSIAAAQERKVDISEITARQVTVADFDEFDLIFGMDADNMSALAELRPADCCAKLAHLGAYVDAGQLVDIPDPYDEGPEAFSAVFDMIDQATQRLAHWTQ